MAIANRTIRSSMLLSTALAALVAVPGVAQAQQVGPGDLVDAIDTAGNSGRLTVQVDPLDSAVTNMTVLSDVVIANWQRFNVPRQTTVNINRDAGLPSATLVNRVIGNEQSVIQGTINAAGVNLWLINQNGILFRDGASITSASFLASTIDVATKDRPLAEVAALFGANANLDFNVAGPGALTTNSPNVNFTTDGSLMFVSSDLSLNATFSAGQGPAQDGGQIVFLTASDVDVAFTPGSPLSYTVQAGTAVAAARQIISGTVTGDTVDFRMMTAATAIDAVLRVNAAVTATRASATETGVLLLADGDATVRTTVTGVVNSAGMVDIDVNGGLTANAAITGSGIDIDVAGAARLNDLRATAAGITADADSILVRDVVADSGNIALDSVTNLTVRDVTATGGGVLLNAQGGNLSAGAVSAASDIRFGTAAAGRASFASLTSTLGTVMNAAFNTPMSLVVTGAIEAQGVELRATDSIVVGNVTARASSANLTAVNGRLVAGNVSATDGSIGLTSGTTVRAGTLTATRGDVVVTGPGAITLGGITATGMTGVGGMVDVSSTMGGTLTVGPITADSDVVLTTTGRVNAGAITAGGAFSSLGAQTVTLNGAVSATSITVTTPGAFESAGLTATTGDITLDALTIVAGDIGAAAGAVSLTAQGNTLSAGNVSGFDGITFTTANTGRATFASLISDNGTVQVSGLVPSALTVTGESRGTEVRLFAGNQLTLGNVTSTAGQVSLDSAFGSVLAGNVTSTGGDLQIAAAGSIRAGMLAANDGDVLVTAGTNITTTAITASTMLATGGGVQVNSTAGNLDLGVLGADADIALDTIGRVTTGAITADGALVIGGLASSNRVILNGDVTASRIDISTSGNLTAQDLTATGGSVDLTAAGIGAGNIRAEGGNANLTADNAITTGAITAGGTINVFSIASGAITLGDLSAGLGIALDTFGRITAGSADAQRGDLVVGGVRRPGQVVFTGDASGENISIDVLGTFRGVGLTASAGNVGVFATAITAGNISAVGGNVRLQAAAGTVTTGNVNAQALAAGGLIDIASTGTGALTLGDLTASEGITLSTSGMIAAGTVSTGGTFDLRSALIASGVTLSGNVNAADIVITTTGAFAARDLVATNGGVDVSARSITAGAIAAAGGDVLLRAALGITTGNVGAVANGLGGGAIDIASTGTGALALGDLQADGNITLGTGGTVNAGAVSSGGAFVIGNAMAVPTTVTLTGDATAQSIAIIAGRTITTRGLTATVGGINLTSTGIGPGALQGDLLVGNLSADGDIVLNTNGNIRAGTVTSFNGNLQVGVPVMGGTVFSVDSVTFAGTAQAESIDIRTTGALDAQDMLSTVGAIRVIAGSITAQRVEAFNGSIALEAVRSISTNTLRADGTITVVSTGTGANEGNLALGFVEAGGNIVLDGNGNITTGGITSDNGTLRIGLASAADNVTVLSDITANSVAIRTTGTLRSQTITATTGGIDLDSTGTGTAQGDLNTGNLFAAGDITLDTNGNINTFEINSRNGALQIGAQSSVDSVTIAAPATAQDVAIRTTGALFVRNLAAITGDVIVTAGSIEAGNVRSERRSVDLEAVGNISTGDIFAGRTIDVDSTGTGAAEGDLNLGALNAGLDITLDTTGDIALRGATSVGGALLIGVPGMGGTAVLSDSVTISGDVEAARIDIRTAGDLSAFAMQTNAGALDLRANSILTGALVATGGNADLEAVGNITAESVSSSGLIDIDSTGTGQNAGTLDLGTLLAELGITLDTRGVIETDSVTARSGSVVANAQAIGTGAIAATRGDVILRAVGNVSTGNISATRANMVGGLIDIDSTGAAGGDLALGNLLATGNITLDTNGNVLAGSATSTLGALLVGVPVVGSPAVSVDSVRFISNVAAQNIDIRTTGTLSGRDMTANAGAILVNAGAISAANLRAVGGDVDLQAVGTISTAAITSTTGLIDVDSTGTGTAEGELQLGDLSAAGNITLDANRNIRAFAVTTPGALIVGAASSADSVNFTRDVSARSIAVTATGNVQVGSGSGTSLARRDLTATNGAITITAGSITGGALAATEGLSLTTTGDIDLASGRGRQVNITANELRVTGALASDTAMVVTAADVEFGGAVTTGGTSRLTLNATRAVAIGPNEASNQTTAFSLSNDELSRIVTSDLLIDAGGRDVGIAGATFGANTGRSTIAVATTGIINITGNLTASAGTRSLRLGGTAAGTGMASRIFSDIDLARVDVGTNALALRGDAIVFGQTGLNTQTRGLSIEAIVEQFIANPASLLYTPQGQSAPVNAVYLTAGSLTVTYGGSALFQNTEPRTAGNVFSGVVLAGGNSAAPALVLSPTRMPSGTGTNVAPTNAFAMFGSINGSDGLAASLLGDAVISVNDQLLRDASRINGCIIGSGAGCFTTIVGNVVLSVPREVVSLIVAEEGLLVPFDPLVGTNNESLFSDAAKPAGECEDRDVNGACVVN